MKKKCKKSLRLQTCKFQSLNCTWGEAKCLFAQIEHFNFKRTIIQKLSNASQEVAANTIFKIPMGQAEKYKTN